MSIDTAFARLRDANPVPEPARLRDKSQDLNALLAATKQRSMEMDSELEIVETAILLLARDTEPDVAGTPQSTSSEPTATYTGGACDYDGPSVFDLNTTVSFTVTNESETTEVGFFIWKFPEDATPEQILEQGIFEFVTLGNSPSFVRPPTAIGEPETLRVFFDSPGQWGISCKHTMEGESVAAGIDYVTMFTVNG